MSLTDHRYFYSLCGDFISAVIFPLRFRGNFISVRTLDLPASVRTFDLPASVRTLDLPASVRTCNIRKSDLYVGFVFIILRKGIYRFDF